MSFLLACCVEFSGSLVGGKEDDWKPYCDVTEVKRDKLHHQRPDQICQEDLPSSCICFTVPLDKWSQRVMKKSGYSRWKMSLWNLFFPWPVGPSLRYLKNPMCFAWTLLLINYKFTTVWCTSCFPFSIYWYFKCKFS